MYCNNCGNKLENGIRFCNKCGNKMSDKDNDELIGFIEKLEGNQTNKTHTNENKNIQSENINSNVKVEEIANERCARNYTNEVAKKSIYWAIKVKNRGFIFAVLMLFSCIGWGIYSAATLPTSIGGWAFIVSLITSIILFCTITAIFYSISFFIRIGSEIIRLLENEKNK